MISAIGARLTVLGSRLSALGLIVLVSACGGDADDVAESREPRAESSLPRAESSSPSADSSPLSSECGAGQSTLLSGAGVGQLRIGATVASIKSRCMVLQDTTLARGVEGQPERRMTVLVASTNTVATVVDDKVWRIEIGSPRFITRDSLGVGSTVADLRSPKARLALGEGAYVLRSDHCGLSFKLSSGVGAFGGDLANVPDSTQVRTVLVTGC